MKGFRSTFIFFLLVLALLVVAIVDHQITEEKQEIKSKESILFGNYSVSDLIKIKIKSSEREILLEKKEQEWMIQSPIHDLADPIWAEQMVKSLFTEKVQLLAEENFNPTQYGLDKNDRYLELYFNKSVERVYISLTPVFDGSSYLKFKDKLYIGELFWNTWVQKPLYELRNRYPFKDLGKVVEYQTSQLSLKNKNGKWVEVGQETEEINQEVVNQNIRAIKALRIVGVAAEDLDKNKNIFQIETGKSLMQLITQENKTPIKIFPGKKVGQKQYFKTSHKPFVYEVTQKALESLVLNASRIKPKVGGSKNGNKN